MGKAVTLEEFSLNDSSSACIVDDQDTSSEKMKLDAFEQGYQSGWEDSTLAHQKDQLRISSELESTLQGVSMTYREACRYVLSSIEPVLKEISEKLFFDRLPDLLIFSIVERLQDILLTEPSSAIKIIVSPRNRAPLENALSLESCSTIQVIENRDSSDAEASLSVGGKEENLDIEEMITSLKIEIDKFFDLNRGQFDEER